MATLDNFGFKARKSTTRVIPNTKVIGERSTSSSFIVPVDIKPIINNNHNKRKHITTTATTTTKSQQQQRTITNYFNKGEEEEEVITCTIKKHISSNEIWRMLETEYTSLIPTPKITGDNNKRRVIETNRHLLKRQRTMDSLSEIMDRCLNVSDRMTTTSFEIIKEQEDDEVLIRPVKKFTAKKSQLLIQQIIKDFIPF